MHSRCRFLAASLIGQSETLSTSRFTMIRPAGMSKGDVDFFQHRFDLAWWPKSWYGKVLRQR